MNVNRAHRRLIGSASAAALLLILAASCATPDDSFATASIDAPLGEFTLPMDAYALTVPEIDRIGQASPPRQQMSPARNRPDCRGLARLRG